MMLIAVEEERKKKNVSNYVNTVVLLNINYIMVCFSWKEFQFD